MEKRKHVNFAIKKLYHLIERSFDNFSSEKNELTKTQGGIIHFLSHSERDIFQKDIEAEFKIRRSSVSVILSSMEKSGYIRRESVDYDARLRRIVLTEEAMELHREIHRLFDEYDRSLVEGLSEEELQVFFRVMDKIKYNIEKIERKDRTND